MKHLRVRSALVAMSCAAALAVSSAFASGDREVTHIYTPPQGTLHCPSHVGIDPGGACFDVGPNDKRVKQIKVVDDLGEPIAGAWEIAIEGPDQPTERYWFCGTWTGDIPLPEDAIWVQVMLYSDLPFEYLGFDDQTPSGCSTVGPTTGEITITYGS